MENYINAFNQFLFEAKSPSDFMDFAKKRHDGAEKIAKNAKEKGGYAMLTYHHFIVKLPYYKKAAAGKFNEATAKAELKKLNKELASLLNSFEPADQTPFQRTMGKIEVVGELLIAYSKWNASSN